MSDTERTIPSTQSKSVCTFTILSEGNAVSRTYHILSIIVNKEFNRIPSATIILIDGDPAAQNFEISNQPDFEPGKNIEIKAGWRGDEETIFKGIVIKHGIKIKSNNSILIVDCKDAAVKMTIGLKNKYYTDSKDSDILEELIGNHGLDKEIETTDVTHKELVQYNSTDWDFMLSRLDVNGKFCSSEDGKIIVKKPEFTAAPVLTIQFGATILDFDAEIDSRFQYSGVKAVSWNYSDQELVNSIEAVEPSLPESGNLTPESLSEVIGEDAYTMIHSGKIQEPEMQAWADAKLQKNRIAKIRGKARVDGFAGVKPGDIIQLNGVGERFEGNVLVTGVRQQIEGGDWNTILQFGLYPEWFSETYDVQQPKAGAMLPAIEGLQIGIVTKLESDPDGDDRIMVRLPVINNEEDGIWCRIATLDAGENRGTFFRPEIGDEVIVGFINNDPRHAVILGMLNSSAKPAPLTASDQNHEKGYTSRSKMKVIFNDDKKTINIETPAGNKMIISEDDQAIKIEDQNGNKFTMDNDGIKIESIKDIILKAANNFSMESVNGELKGSGSMKVEASGSAEISAGGSTTVKGAIVQIN